MPAIHRAYSFRLILGLVLLALSGCGMGAAQMTSTPLPAGRWVSEFLLHPACQPPCWQNITPGLTTMDEAYQVLNAYSEVTSVKVSGPFESLYPDLSKEFDFMFIDDHSGGQVRSDRNGKFTQVINLNPVNLELIDLSRTFGEPDHLYFIARENQDRADAFLYFSPRNMIIVLAEDIVDQKVEFSPNSKITRITLATREMYDNDVANWLSMGGRLTEWRGFGAYGLNAQ